MKKLFTFFVSILIIGIFAFNNANGQVAVTVTNPTNTTPNLAASYTSLANAISALSGITAISGPVTLTADPGTETAPAGGYVINFTAVTTSINNVVITGTATTTITASGSLTVGALNDGIFKIIGSDFVTLQNFTMQENAANIVTTAASNNMTEWGVALLYASTTNGAQNNTIQNNIITLNRTYQNTFGIYSNSTHAATTITSATATTTAGGNSGLKIYGNNISNINFAILVVGPTAAADNNNGVDIGGTSGATANTISNYGTTSSFSGYANVSGTGWGILVRNSTTVNISFNSLTSSAGGYTGGASTTFRGIYMPSFSVAPTGTFTNSINNNTISLTTGVSGTLQGITVEATTGTATASLSINNNNFTTLTSSVASSGAFTVISDAMANLTTNINSNTFTNLTANNTGSFTFISHSFTMPTGGSTNINSNSIVTAFNKTGAGGTVTLTTTNGSSVNGSSASYTNNNFSNITVTGATGITGFNNTDGLSTGTSTKTITGNTLNSWTGGTSSVLAMNISYFHTGTSNVSTNTITNITGQSSITGISLNSSANSATALNVALNTINNLSSTGTGGTVTGITCSNTSPAINIDSNTINTLSSTGASAVTGIGVTGATSTNVFKNKIYNLSGSNASTTVNGILVSSGTAVKVYDNLIGDLRATAANASNPLIGLNITGGTTVNIYYNTVYLNGISSGGLFGSSAISASTTPTLDLRNNIFVNTSTPNGAGLTVAYRRSSTTLGTYAATSNMNDFYAATIFTDGVNTFTVMGPGVGSYINFMATRDANSISVAAPFLSTVSGNPNFLKINTATPTQLESGAANISGITDDFENEVRQGNPGYPVQVNGGGTAPDIGADEFDGTPAVFMSYTSSTTEQITGFAYAGQLNQSIIRVKVVTTGALSPISLTSLTLNANGTTAITDINASTAKVYYTGASTTFSTAALFGATTPTITPDFVVSGTQVLGEGDNYFWLAYDIISGATTGNFIDGECNSINVGSAQTPTVTAPAGNKSILGPLAGDYLVGVALFNSMSGKSVYFERVVKLVTKEMPEIIPSEGKNSDKPDEVRMVMKEVEEVSYIPMENGAEYKGNLFVKKGDNPSINNSSMSGGVYATISAAVADLNARGVSAAVRFLLNDATYPTETYPITLSPYTGASASNTVTIKPNTGVTTTLTGSSATAMFVVNGGDYFIIDGSNGSTVNSVCPVSAASRDLTITNTNTSTTSAVIWLQSNVTDGATNNTIKNCNIVGNDNTQTLFGVGMGSSTISTTSTGTGNNNDSITNNNISKTQYGIFTQGASSASKNTGNVINQNLVNTVSPNNVRRAGVLVGFENNITISGNNISEIASASSSQDVFGIVFGTTAVSTSTFTGNEVTNATVSKNTIGSVRQTATYSAIGIFVAPATSGTNQISNNMISGVSANGTGGDFTSGIFIGGGTGSSTQVYYNSVSLSGTQSGGSDKSFALAIAGSNPTIDVRNNILVNTQNNGTGNNYAMSYGYSSFTNLTSDNNDFFVSTDATHFIGSTASISSPTNQLTFANLQTATGKDGASKNVSPVFISSANLHLNTTDASNITNLNGTAAVIGVTDDIDCDVRNVSTPDIGADEFTPANSAPSITYTLLTNTASVSNRSFTNVTITDIDGGVDGNLGTRPRVFYKKSSDAVNNFNNNTSGTAGWKYAEANGATSQFDFTIDYTLLFGGAGVSTGDVIQYFVVAQDLAGTPAVGINSGVFFATPADVNLAGAFPITGTINSYLITAPPLAGDYHISTTLFNRISGKNISFDRVVKTVMKDVTEVISHNNDIDKSTANLPDEVRIVRKEVEEVSWVPMENGKVYTGSLFAGKNKGTSQDLMPAAYATITAALADLATRGASDSVRFLLDDASYPTETFPLTISPWTGASSANRLIIKPNTGVNTTLTGSSSSGIFVIDGADYVKIDGSNANTANTVCPPSAATRNFIITNTSTSTTSAVIWLKSNGSDGATNNTIENCDLVGSGNTQTFVGVGSGGSTISATSLGTNNNNNSFVNNSISRTQYGIYSQGASIGTKNTNTVINQNSINSLSPNNVQLCGVLVGFEDGVTISGNRIAGLTTTNTLTAIAAGFSATSIGVTSTTGNEVTNATITKNIIDTIRSTSSTGFSAIGISIASASTGINLIANNMINEVIAPSTSPDFSSGIFCGGGAATTMIYYNTISMTYSRGAATYPSYALSINGSTPLVDVRDNILVNSQTSSGAGQCYAIGLGYTSTTGNYVNLTSDNNDLFTSGTSGAFSKVGSLAQGSGTNKTSLSAWNTETGRDGASKNVQPVFISATDLHLNTTNASNIANLNAMGAAVSVLDDIDCQIRGYSTSLLGPPDIGADEFNAVTGKHYVNDSSLVGDSYTSAFGSDANPGTPSDPFLTINYAISQSNPGDTIYVDAGTYTLTTANVVNKKLTFRGRQAGVDAQTRGVVPESVVDATGLSGYPSTAFDVQVAASGSMIDGFTVQGANGGQGVGGIYLEAGTSGDTIQNNIIQNNHVGIFLANNSASDQTVIRQNLLQNNTASGPASGHGIYADEFTASANLQNVLIDDNTFTNTSMVIASWGVGLGNTGATAFTNITFQNNQVSNHGRGMYLYGTTGSTIAGNTFTGATNYAIGMFDGTIPSATISITGNNFSGNFRGIWVDQFSSTSYTGTLSPTGNTFTGGTYHLVNSSTVFPSTVIDAVGNTYDGVLLDGSTTLSDIFTIADKVLDAVDVSTYGMIILRAGNQYVTVNSFYVPGGTSTPLIQRGVNVALATETVHVNSGSYTEQVEINKDLTVIGQGAGLTNVISPATLPLFFTTSANNYPVIYAHDAANIVVRSLTVDGAGQGNANNRMVGVGYYQAGGSMNNLEIKAVRNNPLDGVQGGTGIFAYANTGTARTVSVKQNNVYDFQKNGITIAGLVLTASVDSNTVTGAGSTTLIAQNGVQFGDAKGSVTNNTISGIYYSPATFFACGILAFDNLDTLRITGNTLTSCQGNIYMENNVSVISANDITGGSYSDGIDIISFYTGEITNTIITNNAISGCAWGAYIYSDPADAADAEIHDNSITGSSTYAIQNDGSIATVDAECNWYGTASEAGIIPQINGTVDYTPWLTNGTDFSGDKGFQPVPGSCNGLPLITGKLDLTVNLEAYSPLPDTVTVTLRSTTTPYPVIDSARGEIDANGDVSLNFSNVSNGPSYYIVVNHRQSIETWSAAGQIFSSGVMTYDFTTDTTQAFGNNMTFVGSKASIYTGDVNQDNIVDLTDLGIMDNDVLNYVSGPYEISDLNGDGIVDLSDMSYADNNAYNIVKREMPNLRPGDNSVPKEKKDNSSPKDEKERANPFTRRTNKGL